MSMINNQKLSSATQVIEMKGARGPRTVLKVFDPEASTEQYNIHPIIRRGSNGCYVIAEKPYSLNDGDHYLVYVLAVYEGQYVTWYENLECGGFHGGHYFYQNYAGAYRDFLERGTYRFPEENADGSTYRVRIDVETKLVTK